MAYSLSNNCTKNYWNQTTTVEIIVEGWAVYFFFRHSVDAARWWLTWWNSGECVMSTSRCFKHSPSVMSSGASADEQWHVLLVISFCRAATLNAILHQQHVARSALQPRRHRHSTCTHGTYAQYLLIAVTYSKLLLFKATDWAIQLCDATYNFLLPTM